MVCGMWHVECGVKGRKVSRKDAKTQGIRGKGIRRRRAKAHAPMTFRMSGFPTFHMPHATCRPNIGLAHIPYATCHLPLLTSRRNSVRLKKF